MEMVDAVDGSKTLVFPVGVNQTVQDVTLNSHLHQNGRFTWLFLSCDLRTKVTIVLDFSF